MVIFNKTSQFGISEGFCEQKIMIVCMFLRKSKRQVAIKKSNLTESIIFINKYIKLFETMCFYLGNIKAIGIASKI